MTSLFTTVSFTPTTVLPATQAWWTSPALTQHRKLVLEHAQKFNCLSIAHAQELALIHNTGSSLPDASKFVLMPQETLTALLADIKPRVKGNSYAKERVEKLWQKQLPFILNFIDQALIVVNARQRPSHFGLEASAFAAASKLERGAISVLQASSKWKNLARDYQKSFEAGQIPSFNPLFTAQAFPEAEAKTAPRAREPFTLSFNPRLKADTFVPSRLSVKSPHVLGSLFCYPGIGRLGYSDLPSLYPAASILSDVREDDGSKRIINHQAAKLFATGLSWPYHGGVTEDLSVEQLCQNISAHTNLAPDTNKAKIALGRSFGGSTLLEYVVEHPETFASAFIVSAYSPAWTNFVLASLGNEARAFNYPGWKWVLKLDGYFEDDAPETLTPEHFQRIQDEAEQLSTEKYWEQKARFSQWKLPEQLESRLSALRKLDPNIDELWKRDWSLESEAEQKEREAKLHTLREQAGFNNIKTDVTLLWGTDDDQYPQGVNEVNPLFTTRSFYQALSIAFGFKLLPYQGGHDPFNTRSTNQRIRQEVRKKLRREIRTVLA